MQVLNAKKGIKPFPVVNNNQLGAKTQKCYDPISFLSKLFMSFCMGGYILDGHLLLVIGIREDAF